MRAENYYDILGIGRDADDETVKQAFRELAKACHPDRNPGDAAAEQQFKRINTAYEALKDAARRDAYKDWLEFAETRERSKMAQWVRIAALIAVLIFGPVLLYLALVSTDFAAPSPETPPPAQGVATPAAPPSQPATPPKQAAKAAPDHAMHVAPLPVPETEATKLPRAEPPAVANVPPKSATPPAATNDQGARAGRWEPSAEETLPPVTTESLPSNPNARANPATPQPNPFAANEVPAHPEPAPDVTGVGNGDHGAAPPAQAMNRPAPSLNQPNASGNVNAFIDCDQCPVMSVVQNEARDTPARDRNGRLISREPIAVSKTEITVGEWNACVTDGVCPRYVTASQSDARKALKDVNARDAAVYVDWLSRKTGQSYRVMAENERGAGQRRETVSDTSCAMPGWEWMEDNCPRKPAGRTGFRVVRIMRATPD